MSQIENLMTAEEIRIRNQEFSNEFDIIYNSITSNQAPGLDEYEKSVFLTKAQDEVVKAYFSPKTNKSQEGFDGSEIRQIDFSMLVRDRTIADADSFLDAHFDNRKSSKSIILQDDIFMFINEYVTVQRGNNETRLTVIPISYLEYIRLTNKPYKYPKKNQAWRLLISDSNRKKVELILGYQDSLISYTYRFVRRPKAIRLSTFDGLTIGGESSEECCELDPILFPEIIQRACELAKAAYIGDLTSQVALGQTSQTNMGIVTQSR